MASGDFKNLAERTAADKVLKDKAFNVGKDLKYKDQRGSASVVYKLFDKKISGGGVTVLQINLYLKMNN